MSKRKKRPGRGGNHFWGFSDWGFQKSKACKEMTPEAALVLLNIRAKCDGHKDDSISWAYKDEKFGLTNKKIVMGLFHCIRLGVIEKVDPGGLHYGSKRKAVYALSRKWVDYNPARPGRFLKKCPYVIGEWKKCFDENDQWVNGVNPRKAPYRSREYKPNHTPTVSREVDHGTVPTPREKLEEGESAYPLTGDRDKPNAPLQPVQASNTCTMGRGAAHE